MRRERSKWPNPDLAFKDMAEEQLGESLLILGRNTQGEITDEIRARNEQQRRLYEEDVTNRWSLYDIGRAFGLSYESARQNIIKAGGTIRPQPKSLQGSRKTATGDV